MFGTYVDQPAKGQDGIVFGVEGFDGRKHHTLPWMLAQPFLHEPRQDVAHGISEGIDRQVSQHGRLAGP